MKEPFTDNRTDFIINLANLKSKDSILTVGVAHIPEIERKIENKVMNCNCIDIDLNKLNHAKRYLKKTNLIYGDITNPDDFVTLSSGLVNRHSRKKTSNWNVYITKLDKKLTDKFDTIIMLEVLEHIEDDFKTLKNINNMLKRGGKLIISVPNKHPLHIINPVRYTQHKRHYSMTQITSLLKRAGFSINYTNTVESPKLLFDLYVHLFFKYLIRKTVPFGILTGKKDKTYLKNNLESSGLDSLVVATKDI